MNDIYKRYINPDAPAKRYVNLSYAVSLLFVILGTIIGLFVPSLNDIVLWIVSALYGGYTASNFLKWYWWRFNGYGYFWGMAAGIASAMIVPWLMPDVTALYSFPIILAFSLVGCFSRQPAHQPRRRGGAEKFLPQNAPLGLLETHLRKAARGASGVAAQPGLPEGYGQRAGRHYLADGAGGGAHFHGHP